MNSGRPSSGGPSSGHGSTAPVDPILAKRARIAKLVQLGKRIGYSVLLAAIVAFFVGYFAGFTGALVTGIVIALVVSSIVLAPAIVFGYGVRAAEREDREAAARARSRKPTTPSPR